MHFYYDQDFKGVFMTHMIKLAIFGVCLTLTQSLCASEIKDPLSDFAWKKATTSRDDLFAMWELNQSLVEGSKDRIKYITLEDFGPFEPFYEKLLQEQKNAQAGTVYFDLNPLSGIYLFYPKPDSKPLGFIKVDAFLELGIIGEQIAFKNDAPKGMGFRALQVLKSHIDQYHGKMLQFCVEIDEDTKKYAFAAQRFEYVNAGIEYDNIPSLIAHTRMGMDPLLPIEVDGKKGVMLVYPPLNLEKFEQEDAESYTAHIAPQIEKMQELDKILKQVASQDTRETGLKNLEELKKQIK